MYRGNMLDSILNKMKHSHKDETKLFPDNNLANQECSLTKSSQKVSENECFSSPKYISTNDVKFTEWLLDNEIDSFKEYAQRRMDILLKEDKEISQRIKKIPQFIKSALIDDVLYEANRRYLMNFYDFCIISSELDENYSENLKHVICDRFHLKGCTQREFTTSGNDFFLAYDLMIQRSTKVLFLLTDNFIQDNFCNRIQSSLMWSQLMTDLSKCIAVYPQGTSNLQIPLALAGLVGLDLQKPDKADQLLEITFSQKIRTIRNEKMQQVFNNKCLFIHQMLQQKLQDHIKTQKFSLESKEPGTGRSIYEDKGSNAVCSSLEKSKSDINAYISNSSEIHIGNNITYNYNFNLK